MKKIVKGRSPRLLTQYKAQPNAIYDGPNFTPIVKDKIKDQLLEEQGFLCAYCMKRIKSSKMKVEHFRCQHNFSTLQLDYNNLLGCCNGNEGNPPSNQTCDTRKGSRYVNYSPVDNGFENHISYASSGRITSNDPIFEEQINDILNLNFKRLIDNRKAALAGLKSTLDSRSGTRTAAELKTFLEKYRSKNKKGEYNEYIGVLTDYLEKKIIKTK
ncbi:retron system putative HNH endonuclease [Photobacterium carnosum]|uniref:retron system putative HNH endonuclease n=1 Tax=Photobacterium carnosum TaxID=2023717 RepID=UPI001E58B41A|nr:retron system putative HNH endonuclease [Photobacterium carnosum]MCD9496843.1 TIGR02646 family protein [Photobacterium carnosum]